jgi:hypothetical protein
MDHQGQGEQQHRPNGQCEPENEPCNDYEASAAANMMSHARHPVTTVGTPLR